MTVRSPLSVSLALHLRDFPLNTFRRPQCRTWPLKSLKIRSQLGQLLSISTISRETWKFACFESLRDCILDTCGLGFLKLAPARLSSKKITKYFKTTKCRTPDFSENREKPEPEKRSLITKQGLLRFKIHLNCMTSLFTLVPYSWISTFQKNQFIRLLFSELNFPWNVCAIKNLKY